MRGVLIQQLVVITALYITITKTHTSKGRNNMHRRRPATTTTNNNNNKLLVVMIDGLGEQYVSDPALYLPGIHGMAEQGAKADGMVPVFPTLSYPNYYSIMTGLYPESHGMIHNEMYSREHDEFFLTGTNPEQSHSHWWEDGEPLWVTAEIQGKRCYMYHWPGCEVQIHGVLPTHCTPYVHQPSLKQLNHSLDRALTRMQHNHADLAVVYFGLLDYYGHAEGPGGYRLMDVLYNVDQQIVYLQQELSQRKLTHSNKKLQEVVNVVLVSDHGITATSKQQTVDLLQYIDISDIELVLGGTAASVMMVWTKPNRLHHVYSTIRDTISHVTPYLRHQIPYSYHFAKHKHTPPLLLVADTGWLILKPGHISYNGRGHHGYPVSTTPEMTAVFLATGPDFKSNYHVPAFHNVELYQLMCVLLGIIPAPNNASSWDTVSDLLVQPAARRQLYLQMLDHSASTAHCSVSCVQLITTSSVCTVYLFIYLIYYCISRGIL